MSTTINGTSLWDSMGLSTDATTWYSSLAIFIQGIVLVSIISKTMQYFERYDKSRDHLGMMVVVGCGSAISLGILILTCSQTRVLVYKRKIDAPSSIRYLLLSDMVILFFSGFFSFTTGIYYAWRCYVMTKKNRLMLGVLIVALLAEFIVTLVTAAHGFTLRSLTSEYLATLPAFKDKGNHLHKIWSGITLALVLSMSMLLSFLMFTKKDGIYHYDPRTWHKYFSVTYETINTEGVITRLPPTLCSLLLISLGNLPGSPMTDMRRVFTSILPLLYYNSFIQSLVGRQQIRCVIETKSMYDSGSPLGSNVNGDKGSSYQPGSGQFMFDVIKNKSGPRVYVSSPKRS
ncbi:hypothetical protein L486_05642 [Kwoniella mangroviensis CBS 10435]|uniref:Uncharacterized protein n=1 Tax=Kwoniella mangroviensis CBS 10435 TaxID=1331196 RepID=A0A1B9IMN6_9TREE|nr:hypothetical protein L486_05642 [Kwoniella mangroviensis CBS 10435]